MIRIEDLVIRAGGFSLTVDGLALQEGEFLVILGPTGSGKTVLLETVAGLRRPECGRVMFGGRDVTLEPPERRRVGFVYQDYALFPHLDVAHNIAFGLSVSRQWSWMGGGAAKLGSLGPEVERVAEMLGVAPLLSRYPGSLSGGEKQRVALARALAIEPEVLLLDEPLSAVDRQTREALRTLLKRLHRELGATVMHVTHDLDEALALADRLVVLIDGRVRQVGRPVETVRHPADAEVARLFGLPNVLPVEVVGRDGEEVRVRLGLEDSVLTARAVGPEPAGEAWAVVRAEEVGFLDEAGATPAGVAPENILDGVVTDIRFQTSHASVEVDVPSRLNVHVLAPDVGRLGLTVGKAVRLYVPPDAIHLCPQAGAAPQAAAPQGGV